jgi:predicted nucleic acid-binding protein
MFADAGYWIGIRNRDDVHHEDALGIARRIVREKIRLVVTPFIFAEVYAILSRNEIVRELFIRDVWENSTVLIEQTVLEDQQDAISLLKQWRDKTFSFTDALSFVVMNRLGIKRAISFDKHFQDYGQFEIISSPRW